jgi:hypothetical protein
MECVKNVVVRGMKLKGKPVAVKATNIQNFESMFFID